MRSRAAILTTLVLGFMLSTAGAGLAVTGFAGNDQAAVAQYPEKAPPATTTPPTTPLGGTPAAPGATTEGVDQTQPEQQQVLPDTEDKAAAAPADEVEADRQVAAGVSDGGNLPFTGFAAIPVLLIGLALLSGGMVLRRSARVD